MFLLQTSIYFLFLRYSRSSQQVPIYNPVHFIPLKFIREHVHDDILLGTNIQGPIANELELSVRCELVIIPVWHIPRVEKCSVEYKDFKTKFNYFGSQRKEAQKFNGTHTFFDRHHLLCFKIVVYDVFIYKDYKHVNFLCVML